MAVDPTYAGGYRVVNGTWVLSAPPAAPTTPEGLSGFGTVRFEDLSIDAMDGIVRNIWGQSAQHVLARDAVHFNFRITTVTSTDSASGLPTAGTVTWPDGTTGAFSNVTIDSTGRYHTGYKVTYPGTPAKTVTVSGRKFVFSNGVITEDITNLNVAVA